MRYRYLRDPFFLFCFCLYFANRWVFKPYFPNEFFRSWLNDVICLPFWIPIMLFFMRKVGLRKDDSPPRACEVLVPLLLWSWWFEAFLPRVKFFEHLATSDYLDILAYTAGALLAVVVWKLEYRQRPAHVPRTTSQAGAI